MTIRDAWTRIETWLTHHAPSILTTLNPGAPPDVLRLAERSLGVSNLPTAFVESWQIHDGQAVTNHPRLVQGWPLLPLARILELRDDWNSVAHAGAFEGLSGEPHGPVRGNWWNPRWIPIAENGVGDLVCLDMDPPADGRVGQVIEVLHDDLPRTVLAPDFGLWLTDFVTDLELGLYHLAEPHYGLVHVRDL